MEMKIEHIGGRKYTLAVRNASGRLRYYNGFSVLGSRKDATWFGSSAAAEKVGKTVVGKNKLRIA